MHSQSNCDTGEGEKFEYEKGTTLCEQYGSQTPTISIVNGFSSDYPSGDWNNEVVYINNFNDQYGPAVYMAQGMLPPCQWETVRERSAQACEGMERPGLPIVKVDQVNEQKFSVYPNPGNGEIQLQFKNEVQELDYIIMKNIYGQEVLRQIADWPIIDTSSLPSAVYYVEYWRAGDLLTSVKLVRM